MRHLNYNHLLYFWTVARDGSIAKASQSLHLTPQTISGQLKLLEESIGQPLFERVGRGLVLTSAGQLVNHYADEIFSLGAELTQRVKNADDAVAISFRVGIVSSIAKLIAYRILKPALALDERIKIVCHEASLEQLLGDLAVHQLDLVISDRMIPTGLSVKAYNHRLGDSGLGIFAPARSAAKFARNFPRCLDRADMLLPVHSSALRRGLDEWFEQQGLAPKVVAEFEDTALLKAFGEAGAGLFPAPAAIAEHIQHMYRAKMIGTLDGLVEHYYAISPERKLKHPAVLTIIESARNDLFS